MIKKGTFYNWGPFLWRTKLDKDFCDELLKRSEKPSVKANPHNAYLAGHLEEEYGYLEEDVTWCAEKISPYVEHYLNAGHDWYKRSIGEGAAKLDLVELWVNYMKKGDSNPVHIHYKTTISFVIYLKVPEAIKQEKNFSGNYAPPGSIIFFYGEELDNFISSYAVFPEEGDMFMFPSQLRHLVVPFRSDVVRISVAGNLLFA
jgi:uncharacterized protein (TIGR02466 family)